MVATASMSWKGIISNFQDENRFIGGTSSAYATATG